jgi:hypothetical protein
MIKIPYTKDNRSYAFNIHNFEEEILPSVKPNGIDLVTAIHNYFEFTTDTLYNNECFYSNKFDGYILPLCNEYDKKNFIIIKGNHIFNPNEFVGFACSNDLSDKVLITDSIHDLLENKHWIFVSDFDFKFIKRVIDLKKVEPYFADNMKGKLMELTLNAPESWIVNTNATVRINKPSIEDRTILINLLDAKDYIEFDDHLIICITDRNIKTLITQSQTLYSTL